MILSPASFKRIESCEALTSLWNGAASFKREWQPSPQPIASAFFGEVQLRLDSLGKGEWNNVSKKAFMPS
jgi:hypothetical protein